MKKALAGVLGIVISLSLCAQKEWKKFNVDSRVSVSVPGEMQKGDMENLEIWELELGEDVGMTIAIVDLVNYGLDSAMIQAMVETDEFKEQYVGGFMTQFPGSELASTTKGKVGSFTTYLLEVNMKDETTGESGKVFSYAIFVGAKVYSFNYAAKEPVKEDRDKFFKSVVIN